LARVSASAFLVVVQFDSSTGIRVPEDVGVRFIGPAKGLDESSPYTSIAIMFVGIALNRNPEDWHRDSGGV
jgi:hypothetical protein